MYKKKACRGRGEEGGVRENVAEIQMVRLIVEFVERGSERVFMCGRAEDKVVLQIIPLIN